MFTFPSHYFGYIIINSYIVIDSVSYVFVMLIQKQEVNVYKSGAAADLETGKVGIWWSKAYATMFHNTVNVYDKFQRNSCVQHPQFSTLLSLLFPFSSGAAL